MTTTLQISIIPKRMLTRTEAAHHCGRSVRRFEIECPCNPSASRMATFGLISRNLDLWLTSLKAGGDQDADAIVARLA